MRGNEAKEICDDLELVRVPVVRGKADLSKYRNAGKEVAAVLQTFTPLMTRASVDEAYLDLTERVNSRLSDMNKVILMFIFTTAHTLTRTKSFLSFLGQVFVASSSISKYICSWI